MRRQVLITVPSRVLLEQFAPQFPTFCKAGTGYNKRIRKRAPGFVAVTDSVRFLKDLEFEAVFVDEAHHPLAPGLPESQELYLFSATHRNSTDFEYSMAQAIEDGVLCDYDLTVPVITEGHAYLGLANLLLRQPGRFRRVLAYCNTVAEAKRFRRTLEVAGIAAWHINGNTERKKRAEVLEEFSGNMKNTVHVLVTVQVLGEGVNIPNADTCMFVEPRSSYTSIVQAIGRILRQDTSKPLAHIILPAMKMHAETPAPASGLAEGGFTSVAADDAADPSSWDAAGQERQAVGLEPAIGSTNAGPTIPARTMSEGRALAQVSTNSKTARDERHVLHSEEGVPNGPSTALASQENHSQHAATKSHATSGGEGLEVQKDRLQPAVLRAATTESEFQQHPTKSTALHQNLEVGLQSRLQAQARASKSSLGKQPHAQPANEAESNNRVVKDVPALAPPMQNTLGKKLKLTSSSSVQTEQSYTSQLERFLSTIAQADSRLADLSSLGSRLWFTTCNSVQATSIPAATTRGWYSQLAIMLQTPDRWEARMLQLEDFAKRHRRLPRVYGSTQEKSLFYWLKNAGYLIARGGMGTSQRFQRFLASSSQLVIQRALKWQDREAHFRRQCAKLRDYVDKFQCLPQNTPYPQSESHKLAKWLSHQRKDLFRNTFSPRRAEDRKSAVINIHPLVAKYVQSRRPQRPETKKLAAARASKLLRFVHKNGQLPRATSSAEECSLYQWMWRQRRQMAQLSPQQQSELFGLHPLITAFWNKLYRKRRQS